MDYTCIQEVIKRLIGSIKPVGESHIDTNRFNNLNHHSLLAECLIGDLIESARDKDRVEGSMKRIGAKAHMELIELKNMIDEYLEEF